VHSDPMALALLLIVPVSVNPIDHPQADDLLAKAPRRISCFRVSLRWSA